MLQFPSKVTILAGVAAAVLIGASASAQFAPLSSIVPRVTGTIVNDNLRAGIRDAILPALNIRSSAGSVGALAVSRSGVFLATAPADWSVRIWDLKNGLETQRLRGLSSAATAVAINEDDTIIAAGDEDGVKVWNLQNGKLLHSLSGHDGPVTALAFGKAPNMLLTGGQDDQIAQWNLTTGEEEQRFTDHEGDIRDIAISASGDSMVSGDENGAVLVWDLETGAVGEQFGPIQDSEGLAAIAMSPDGRYIATGDDDGEIKLWEADGSEIARFGSIDGPVEQLNFNSDGSRLVSVGSDNFVTLWDVEDRDELRKFEGHRDQLLGVGFESRHGMVLSASKDGVVRLWNPEDGVTLARLISTTAGWAVIDGEGRFDGSLQAVRDIAWTGDEGEIEIDRMSERFFQDGLLAMMIDPKIRQDLANAAKRRSERAEEKKAEFEAAQAAEREAQIAAAQAEALRARLAAQAQQLAEAQQAAKESERQAAAQRSAEIEAERKEAALAAQVAAEHASKKEAEAAAAKLAAAPAPTPDSLKAGLNGVPKVKLLKPLNGESLSDETVQVVVQVVDEGSGVDEIRLYHNGRIYSDTGARSATLTERSGAKRLIHTFQLSLANGDNHIEAVAFSSDRVESKRSEANVVLEGPPEKPTLHVLAIGINEYKNPALNLNYGVSDASGIIDMFKAGGNKLFEKVNIIGLFNENATRKNILEKIGSLRNSDPNDVIVVYMAGHGEITEDGTWYFLPHEVVYPEREEQLKSLGLASSTIQSEIAKVGGRKVILLIDSCKSGGALVAFRGFEERKALRQLARSSGMHIVAAAAQDQFAGEVARLNHGVFTYVVLEALAGTADGAPKDGVVSVREMLSYVENRMPEISRQERSQAQYPVVDSRGMDFPVIIGQ
jgi:WD40 repeat protein